MARQALTECACRLSSQQEPRETRPSSGPDWSTVAGGSRLAGSSGRLAGELADQAPELGRIGDEPGWLRGTEPEVANSQLKGWQEGTEPAGE